MPKIKTRKGIKKRVKISKKGKVLIKRSGKSHLLTTKTRKRKRKLRSPNTLEGPAAREFKKLLPYD